MKLNPDEFDAGGERVFANGRVAEVHRLLLGTARLALVEAHSPNYESVW